MNRIKVFRNTGLAGYLGVLILLPLWYFWLAPPVAPHGQTMAIILIVPLLLPFAGMLRNKQYTYAWSGFLSMLYFMHGVGEAWTLRDTAKYGYESYYGWLEIILSLMWFVGSIFYVRLCKQKKQG